MGTKYRILPLNDIQKMAQTENTIKVAGGVLHGN